MAEFTTETGVPDYVSPSGHGQRGQEIIVKETPISLPRNTGPLGRPQLGALMQR